MRVSKWEKEEKVTKASKQAGRILSVSLLIDGIVGKVGKCGYIPKSVNAGSEKLV